MVLQHDYEQVRFMALASHAEYQGEKHLILGKEISGNQFKLLIEHPVTKAQQWVPRSNVVLYARVYPKR